MKKIYLMTAFAATSAFAQPVINENNVQLNLTSDVFMAETDGFDPGTAGPNKTWDFSTLEIIPIGTSWTTQPSETPAAGLFPTANFCSATSQAFSYFRHNAQKMELLGEVYVGIGVINYNNNPKTYVEFPYTYNRVINDTYKASTEAEVSFVSTYDAYGTLVMPFGTYTNVVRQKIVENGQTNYIWFNASPFFPIIQTSMADGVMGISKTTALGTGQFAQQATFAVFPNPTSGAFQVDMKHFEGADIAVYDMLGKLVASEKASGSLTPIDLGSCNAGVYFVKVTKDGQASVEKIVKK